MEKLEKHAWERNFYVDLDTALEKDGYIEKWLKRLHLI
jgi:hypothetical protein